MRFGIGSASSADWIMPGSRLAVVAPGFSPLKNRNSPLPSFTPVSYTHLLLTMLALDLGLTLLFVPALMWLLQALSPDALPACCAPTARTGT